MGRGRPSKITEEMQNPELLKYATEEEREVLELRWKSITSDPLTQTETANALGMTVGKIKKLEDEFKRRVIDKNDSEVTELRRLAEELSFIQSDLTRLKESLEETQQRTTDLWNAMSKVKFKRGFVWGKK